MSHEQTMATLKANDIEETRDGIGKMFRAQLENSKPSTPQPLTQRDVVTQSDGFDLV